ncbi:putative ribonuclease H-like domain-containing protein [Tanacetum coccineum]
MNQFCEIKGIKREFSVVRTPQQNGVAERRNRTLIEAARIMLVDSKLSTTFWAEAANTACYVLNRVLVIKPHNKTPYELIHGRTPLIDFMKPFRCPVTILNIRDHLGKFDGKADGGFFVGYSVVSKVMRVFNKRIMIVEETLNIRFLKNTPNVTGNGPDWLFDVDSLTISMNYVSAVAGNQTNGIARTRDNIITGQAEKKVEPEQEYILIPICTTDLLISQDPKVNEEDAEEKPTEIDENRASDKDGKDDQATRSEFERLLQQEKHIVHPNITNSINTASTPVSAAGPSFTNDDLSSPVNAAEASNAFEEHLFKKADLNNLETTMNASPIPTTRIDKDYPKDQIIGDFNSAIQIKRMTKISDEHVMKVWTLVNLPNGKRAIETKWVFRNKKDERGIVVRNKARLVAQGYTQEEEINYHEVFAPVARIEAIRLFLAYASFMGFIVYQMDVKSAFLYGTIDEEVYVCQPPGFEDPQFPDKVYKVYVDDIIFGSTKKSLCDEFEGLMHKRFQMSSMGELSFFLWLQVQQKKDGIFISQDKYMADILKKFDFATMKTTSTPMEPNKALIKDGEADSVDVYLYRSMIGSLMYLTASRPNIMFVVCACAWFQVTPKMSHLHAVKRIFRYLKGQPKLGLWYLRYLPFDLEAFSDSDYAGSILDRKSTTGGCQFLGKRLISWQCKKKTIIANSATEVEYVAATIIALDTGDRLSFSTDSDFLSTCSINYALTVSPTIYASYIEQFWNTVTSKIVNSVKQIHAIIDGSRYRWQPQTPRNHRGALAQARSERVLEKTNEPPLSKVLALEEAKTAQDRVITRLKLRVKRLEKKVNARTLQPMKKRLFKGRVESSDDDLDEEDASKQGRESDKTKLMFQDSNFDVFDDDMEDVEGEIVHTATTGVSVVSAPVTTDGVAISTAEPRTPPTTAATAFIDEDFTIAQTLMKMKE